MSRAYELRNLNLDVFCYDHWENLGDDADKVNENRIQFWQRLDSTPLSEEQLKDIKAREENGKLSNPLLPSPHRQELAEPWDGFYAPRTFGDCYGLQINCSGEKSWRDTARQLSDLGRITEYLRKIHKSSGQLGETWLVRGQLTRRYNQEELSEIAKTIATILGWSVGSKWNENQDDQSSWQGATFFEFKRPLGYQPIGNLSASQLVICLFAHHQKQEAISDLVKKKLYVNLRHLFFYRSKVFWIYRESREIKQELKSLAAKVQSLVEDVQMSVKPSQGLSLTQLSKNLQSSLAYYAKYAEWLSYLEEYRYALKVNGENYHKRLQRWLETEKPGEGDFFLDFYDDISEQFIPQVTNDYNTLAAGLKLLENLIKTTEGLINLEQTRVDAAQGERDRNLENAIAAVGVGVGVSSTAVTTFSEEPAFGTKLPFEFVNSPWYNLGFSILLGAVLGWITYGLLRWVRRNKP